MTWSNLHEACKHNETENILQLAKRDNEDAYQTDDHLSTPLHLLCLAYSPDPVALKSLVHANPVAVSDRDINGDTPLHLLCHHAEVTKELVEILVQADHHCLAIANKHGYLPLHVACRCSPTNLPVIVLLLKINPLASISHVKMGELVKHKNENGNRSVNNSSNVGNVHLIDQEAGLKTKDSVDLRLMQTQDFERDGGYPLHIAIAHGAPLAVVQILAQENTEVLRLRNKYGQTPLLVALKAQAAQEDVIHFLIHECHAALHMTDKAGNLPLHEAAKSSAMNPSIVRAVLRGWPDAAFAVNGDGLTARELAIRHCDVSEDVMTLFSVA